MLLEVNSTQDKRLKKLLSHIIPLLIVVLLIPIFFLFEICIVLPEHAEQWSFEYCYHIFNALFILSNILSNLLHGAFTNTSIHGLYLENVKNDKWTSCIVCECMRPPRAWHCDICNICILKRDHHCIFLATCVGYFNYRYFIMFTFYVFVAMMYSLYYNIQYMVRHASWNGGVLLLKIFCPLGTLPIDYGWESWFVFLIDINVLLCMFSGYLLYFHLDNIVKGRTTPERKHTEKDIEYNLGLKLNILEVFGKRWYLTWISAFVQSPLPGNGIDWENNNKNE